MDSREYRFRSARIVRLPDALLVQLPSRSTAKLALDGGTARPYRGEGPVWIRIGDRTGLVPELEDELPSSQDTFGAVLTEIIFVGEATAWVEGQDFVIQTAGNVQILEGANVIPFTAGELMGSRDMTWVCSDVDGNPHQPV